MVALPLVVLVLALVLGVPIAVALAGAGILGIYVVTGDFGKVMGIVSLAPFSTVADYALTTIPMFILMAFFSASSGLARDLYTAASNWCSHIKGGLAIATVFACGIFGAMSGASTAAASVMSKIAMPEMRRHGYSDELAAGAIGIGATLDILIPPSIAMVIYGVATQTSIGKLLIAGVIPGLIAGVLLAADRLHPSSKGARVRFDGSSRTVIDGPFTEAKELVAGFWIWQVRSLDEAIEWLKRAPFDGGEFEIRQIFEMTDLGDALTPELVEQWERLGSTSAAPKP